MKKWIVAAVLAALALFWVWVLAGRAGEHAARVAIERTQTVWPNVMQLPVPDRAIIARASILCELTDQHKSPDSVVACLRAGALKADERDKTNNAVPAMERLLTQAGRDEGSTK